MSIRRKKTKRSHNIVGCMFPLTVNVSLTLSERDFSTRPCRILSAVRCLRGFLPEQPVSKSPRSTSVGFIFGLWCPFLNYPFPYSKECLGGFTGMLIIGLHGPHVLQLQCLTDGLTFSSSNVWRIHSWFSVSELAGPCCRKSSPKYEISPPGHASQFEVLVLKCCLQASPLLLCPWI